MINSWVQSLGLLILRVSFGTMMLAGHGLPKLLEFSSRASSFPDLIGVGSYFSLVLAIAAEFFCSVLLILGIGTRLAVLPLIVTMLVAATMFHGADPWAKKELAVCYLSAFIVIFICGGGGISLDRLLWRWMRGSKASRSSKPGK